MKFSQEQQGAAAHLDLWSCKAHLEQWIYGQARLEEEQDRRKGIIPRFAIFVKELRKRKFFHFKL